MDNINNILNKYFDGESSIEDEKILIRYFQSDNIKEEHSVYTAIFQHFAEEKEINKIVNSPSKTKRYSFYLAAASCAAIVAGLLIINTLEQKNELKSVAYVDGKKIENMDIIKSEALNSIISIQDNTDTGILQSQIDLLEAFTE